MVILGSLLATFEASGIFYAATAMVKNVLGLKMNQHFSLAYPNPRYSLLFQIFLAYIVI